MKSNTKIIIAVGIVVALLLVFIFVIGQQKNASVLQVQVEVKGDLENSTIDNINAHLESVKQISEPKGGTTLFTPGITVVVIQDMQMIGEWTSVPYDGPKVYNFTVGLTKYPKSGDNVSVVVRVINAQSQNIQVVGKSITLK